MMKKHLRQIKDGAKFQASLSDYLDQQSSVPMTLNDFQC